MLTFQQIIQGLQNFWGQQGCALLQPYDMEVGAGTSHTATFLRALGPEPWRAAYVQPSRRPKDGRYGDNPNRMQHYYQYQVVLKPSPPDILDLYLRSLEALGLDLATNDVRFVEDDWENPTLGAWGLGWEVWLNGMEITQFTYFQQVGGLECDPITGEITYGIERLAMYLQEKESLFDLVWTEWTERGVAKATHLPRRLPPERSRAVDLQLRAVERAEALRALRFLRVRREAPARGEAPAAGLRDDSQGRAHVQPAGRARRDLGDRARGVHRAHPDVVAPRSRRPTSIRARRSGFRCCPRADARGMSAAPRANSGAKRGAVTARPLVVEVVTEELPPKALRRLGEAFAQGVAARLGERGYLEPGSAVTPFATPRRLAVAVTHVRGVAPDSEVIDKLMPARVGLDASGNPSEALTKKLVGLGRGDLAAAGVDAKGGPDRLYVASDGKADYVYLRSLAKGQPLVRGLQDALDDAIGKLPIPKVMSYAGGGGYYNDVKFVRPARRLLALHGADVVPVAVLGLAADRVTTGHRFRSRDGIRVATAEAYEETLRAEGKVVASFAARRALIVAGLCGAAADATVIMPEALLDEVTALVESPAVYEGAFDPAFLAVPQECLDPDDAAEPEVLRARGERRQARPALPRRQQPRDGGSRRDRRRQRARAAGAPGGCAILLRPGQEGAARGACSAPRLDRLSQQARDAARPRLAPRAPRAGARRDGRRGRSDSARAATLAKADLTTDMVGEFPELQGLMGRYYAEHDGESAAIAAAIEQHYWPRFAGDALPEGPVAQAVALADKLETLAGLFGIGAQPTGDKDPFGLRRHAIGAIRILVEKALRVTLADLVDAAFRAFAGVSAVQDARTEVENFVYERLRGYLREAGYSANQVEAVISQRPARIDQVPAQAAAVRAFGELPESQTLAAANKRIVNILRKSGEEAAPAVDRGRLADGAEHDLYLVFQKLEPVVVDRCAAGDFAGALLALAGAKPAVDRFFDDVLVMAEDPAIRANRLALLRGVAQTMNRVADISKLAA